ncbi:hypothetical protein [Nibricoccus sp. IMCC34717]|uniref:hypothetical protein n=1 Tax=Nibricoccus sp. IMCC34717 TaxID=3034021 RepID=UPI00384E8392
MPDRLLRDGFKHSPRVNLLDDREECAFVRLLTTVDDGGVYYADPLLVRAAIWPSKSYRLADVARVLDKLERVGLIARWTDGNGTRYLCLLRFRQRLKYSKASPFPRPPFDADSGEVELELPICDPPLIKKEEKRREEKKAVKVTASLSLPKTDEESEEAFVQRLAAGNPGIDLAAQERACRRYCQQRGRTFERGYFERWLATASPLIEKPLFSPQKMQQKTTEEPEGWRSVILDTQYGPGGCFEVDSWAELPSDVQAFVLGELRKSA